MRAKFWLISFLSAVLLTLTVPQTLRASHAQGLDLSYQCLGGNQYAFTLNFYRDCSGIGAPNSVNINLASVSCGANFNIVLTNSGSISEVSPLCAAQLAQSTCATPPCVTCLPGVEQYIYTGTFTFTQSCPDWVVSFEECCRNNSVTNLQNPAGRSLFVSATLDNSGGLCNSSPVFTSTPVPYVCAEQQYCYNHGAFDPDGDSLAYSLVAPQEGPAPGINIPYSSPALSATLPLFDTTGAVQFDPQTGSLCIIPTDTLPQQVIVVAVEVEEWRNGALLGTTRRDIQLVVLPCANTQPDLMPRDVVNLVGGAQIDSNSVEICPGVPLTFDVVAGDANPGDIVTMLSNATAAIPGSNFTTTGNNPVTGTFSWTPTTGDVGFHNFTVSISDDGCPILGSQIFNFDITVVPSTEAGPDLAYCPAGGPVQLGVVGGQNFTWSTISGGPANLSCTNCPNPTTAPATSAMLEVLSDLSPVCKNRDTITVNVVPDFILDLGNDTTICRFGLAQINGSATPTGTGFSPYVFNWSPADSLSDPTIVNPTANPIDTTQYVVTATSAAGCTIRDTININIDGVAPQIVVEVPDTVCVNESLDLNSVLFQECGITTVPCSGPNVVDTIGFGTFSSQDFGPFVLDGLTNISNKRQYIITAAELAASGLQGGGRINALGLEVVTSGNPITGVQIRMGCIPDSTFPNSNFFTGLSLVKNSFTWIPAPGWSDQTLDFPYMWDGTSNLVVEICVDPLQATGAASTISYDNLSANVTNIANSLAAGACGITSGSPIAQRPRFRFDMCEAIPPTLTYLWVPGTDLNNPAIADPTATPTATTTYTVNVTDGLCIGTDQVTVVASPRFNIDAGPDTTLCLNQPYLANPTLDPGTYTYNWTPVTGVTDATDPNTQIFAPDTTTYVLSATSADDCTLADSLTISIDGVAPLVLLDAGDTICPGTGLTTLNPTITSICGITSNPCTGPSQQGFIEDPAGFASSIYGPHFIFQGINSTMRRQNIFTQTELDTMGLVPGHKITAISLEYSNANQTNSDVVVRMGCTNLDEFDASLTFVPGLTTVMTSTAITPAVGYTTFNFTSDYTWDGTSNIIVEICVSTPQTGLSPTSASDVRVHNVGGNINRTLYANDFAGTDGCAIPVGTARAFFRPNIRFDHCEAIPPGLNYTWTPATGLSSPTAATPTAQPTTTTTYNLVVDGGGSCTGGDQITVAIDSTNFVTANSTITANCPTQAFQLDAVVSGPLNFPNLGSCGVNGTACTQPLYSATVGTGTASANTFYSPFFFDNPSNTDNSRIQYLYRASDLLAAGVQSGTITALGVPIASADSLDLDALQISIGCTNQSNLSTGVGFLPTTVVNGPAAFNPANGLAVFTLTSPFDWDGTSNLVVEFCNSNTIAGNPSLVNYTTTTGHNGTMINFNTTGPGCSITAAGATVLPGFMNLQFTVCPPPPTPFTYAWAPNPGLSNTTISNPTFADPDPLVADTLLVLVSGGACDVFDTVFIPTCPLPVEWMELRGEIVGATNVLDWDVEGEWNVDRYLVQRMEPDGNWEDLGEVTARQATAYQWTDERPLVGANVYQVIAVDQNGATTESNSVMLYHQGLDQLIDLYPNPTTSGNGYFLDYQSTGSGPLEITVTDLWGRVVWRGVREIQEGFNHLALPANELAQGSYLVRTQIREIRQQRKLLIID